MKKNLLYRFLKTIKPISKYLAIIIGYLFLILLLVYGIYQYTYRDKIYPGVFVAGTHLGNWTEPQAQKYFIKENRRFDNVEFEFLFEDKIWATDGAKLNWGVDEKKTSRKAYNFGRQGNLMENLRLKYQALILGEFLEPEYHLDESSLVKMLDDIGKEINIPEQEALFEFSGGKVIAFRTSKTGRKLNTGKTIKIVREKLETTPQVVQVKLPVDKVRPKISTDQANNMGIKELIGTGVSYFKDSIPERVYNLSLASSRLHGILIKKGETFSFNKSVGKITSQTGYKKAYIIRQGKTILDDGGGVCQVSTTLYRAVLYSGLPVTERIAHAYRVSYYEPPVGLDATVFDPSPDFKFKNDTPGAILIQAYVNYDNQSLTFEFYGTSDGRKTIVSQPVIVSQTPPPEPVYQDDPTLVKGTVKQVDTAHWGAKVYFQRKVERDGEVLIDEQIWSNYIPWAAVYLKGTRE